MLLLNRQIVDQPFDPVARPPDFRQLGSILAIELVTVAFMLVAALVFPVAAPAAVVEDRGVFAALRRSALLTKGARSTIFVIGIILTGANEDGALGLARIKKAGGVALIQDPLGAARRTMPDAAIAATVADAILPLEEIGKFVYGLWVNPSAVREAAEI